MIEEDNKKSGLNDKSWIYKNQEALIADLNETIKKQKIIEKQYLDENKILKEKIEDFEKFTQLKETKPSKNVVKNKLNLNFINN
jgi:hypothetical protein